MQNWQTSIFAYEILLRVCSIKVTLLGGLDDTLIPFRLKNHTLDSGPIVILTINTRLIDIGSLMIISLPYSEDHVLSGMVRSLKTIVYSDLSLIIHWTIVI